jgi:hypothetical protein
VLGRKRDFVQPWRKYAGARLRPRLKDMYRKLYSPNFGRISSSLPSEMAFNHSKVTAFGSNG